jgi:tetratricopeptide (TPR) repeat protein
MAKTPEMSRKDMKEPDQFQQVAGQAAGWLTGHKNQSLVVAGAVAAVVLLVGVVTSVREHGAEKVGGLLSAVYQAAGGEVSPIPVPGYAGPLFASDAARQKAVLEAAGKVIAEASGSPQAALATLAKGDAHYRLGEWDQAAAAYQSYLAAAGKGEALRFGALEGLALVAEAKGNAEAAQAAWATLASEAPAFADRADLEKARLLAGAGKAAAARKLLAGFAEAHQGSPLASEAASRLAALGGP